MAFLICGDTLTDAWLADFGYLHDHNGEQLNLVTTITDPNPEHADIRVIGELDDWLLRKQKQRVETVANTIFPQACLRGSTDRQQFYERYLALVPRLRKQRGSGSGTYFGRLTEYPATADLRNGSNFNQIEAIIQKLGRQLTSNSPEKRFTYQAQVFIPSRDTMSIMSFPCMSLSPFNIMRSVFILRLTTEISTTLSDVPPLFGPSIMRVRRVVAAIELP